MINTRALIGSALASSLLVLAACSDAPTQPSSRSAPSLALSSVGGQGLPALFPNSRRYREQTVPHTSNRSGSATLTGRALLAKDGSTALEVTTGDLSTAVAPGNITKLQLKIMDPDGVPLTTENFNGLSGGYQTRTLPGLSRHQRVQVQGNVRDIDPRRTDVVTLTERVNLRPDIAITGLAAPDKVPTATRFIVTATAAELNGDVGATSNCVLYVDGAVASRIPGMWIADGDDATCAFQLTIFRAGSYTLTAKAESVVPADWDVTNNVMSRSIEVVLPPVVLHGNARATEHDFRYLDKQSHVWSTTGERASNGRWLFDRDQTNRWQNSQISGFGGRPIRFPLSALTFALTSAGGTHVNMTVANAAGPVSGCSYVPAGQAWASVCTNGFFSAGHSSSLVTYYDHQFSETFGWEERYSEAGPFAWTINEGGYLDYGDQLAFKAKLTDFLGREFTADAVVSMGAWIDTSPIPYSYTCSTQVILNYTSLDCYEREHRVRNRSASATY